MLNFHYPFNNVLKVYDYNGRYRDHHDLRGFDVRIAHDAPLVRDARFVVHDVRLAHVRTVPRDHIVHLVDGVHQIVHNDHLVVGNDLLVVGNDLVGDHIVVRDHTRPIQQGK